MTEPKDTAATPDATPDSPDLAAPDLATAARKSAGRGVWMGTAVGIGSAAIVAALLFTNRKKS